MDAVFKSFAENISAIFKTASKEEAKGIPSRSAFHELPKFDKPKIWQLGVHDHEARRKGRHFDLRLGDPSSGRAHSWVIPTRLPSAGESAWAVQQPTHTLKYMDFEGEIPEGYGAGKVKLHLRDKVEAARSSPGHIAFNLYKPGGTTEFVLHRIKDKMWKLYNTTPTREKLGIEEGKPKYKEISPEKITHEDKYVMSAKIDDAHNLFVFPQAGKQIRAISHRTPKRPTAPSDVIDHVHKLEDLYGKTTPKELANSVFRGGVYALSKRTGKAVAPETIGGLLNTDVWKSRDKQKSIGKLISVLYDVDRFKGKDVSKAPYAEKLKMMEEAVKLVPGAFHLPPMAYDEKSKRKLLADIAADRLPHTKEGVVLWNLYESNKPAIKAKFAKDHDVYVRRIFPGEGKYLGNAAGGFEYSHSPDGPIVGRVGTGLSDALRRDMHLSPGKYIGATAVVAAQEKFKKTESLRAPRFMRWHLDKNPSDVLDTLVQK